MKKVLVLLALAGLMLSLAACNTVKGVGRDVEDVGQAMEDAVN